MSIAKRLLISILSVSVIAFLIIMLVFMISLRKSLEKSAMKTAEEMTFRYVNYVDSELESILSRAKVIAQFIPLMTNRRYKQEELDQIFLEKLENNDHYISIWTYSEIPNSSIENRLYQKNHSTYSRLTHEDIFYFDLKDTYQKVIKHNHEMITAPFFILDKQQIICSLVIPVMKDSVFAGIIGIDLNVFYIKEKLNEIKPWSEGYFILVDNTGRRISHIRPDLLSKPVGDDTPAVKEDLLKAIRNGEGFSFSKYALGTGKLSLMTYQPIKIGENPDPWSLCLVLPMYKVLEEANYLTAFLAVISLIFLCVITFSIFKNISLLKHSIFNINNESKRIIHAVESSNLSVRANVNVVKPDFRLIIHSFNEILDKIEQKDNEKQIINTELLNTKNLLDNIIESSPSLLIAFDKDYRVYLWNYASEQYTHIPAKQAIGKNLYDLFPEVLPFSTFISEVFEQNREIVIRHQSIKSDNSFFNLYVYPLNDKTDRHAVLRLDDISELEKREAELRQSQKMELVGNLAGGLAHDFNNILGIIIGNLSLINAKIKFSNHIEIEEIKEFISKLQKAGERASSLVKQLLSLARKKEIKYVQFSVNEMLGRVIDLARNTLDKSIHFQMEILDSNIQIFADEGQIEQVILNLIINASHALTIMQDSSFTKNGFIKISSQIILSDYTFKKRHIEAEKNSYLCISVEDNGIGMDSNTVSKIFEPFFTTKSVGVGTGLGLAMVYNIIKNHNGFIDVYSEPGIGTKMSVYLPIVEGLKTDNSQHTSGIIKGNGLVLIIDDDTKMRDIACKMLKFMNFNVIQAENGQIGLDLYQQYQTEILFILLDVVMPVKSGDQTMQALVRINPKVKVIVSSGFKKDNRVTQILNNGAIAFIQKPYTIEELSETIRINLLN